MEVYANFHPATADFWPIIPARFERGVRYKSYNRTSNLTCVLFIGTTADFRHL